MGVIFDPRVFATLSITLNVLSALRYGWAGDWARCVYWTAAAVLTLSVTYTIGR